MACPFCTHNTDHSSCQLHRYWKNSSDLLYDIAEIILEWLLICKPLKSEQPWMNENPPQPKGLTETQHFLAAMGDH